MIEANKNDLFPIIVSLYDEDTSELVSGMSVTYDIRTIEDFQLVPPISGTLAESTIEGGIYRTELSIPDSGSFICYVSCSGFITSTEDIKIRKDDLADMVKYNLPYNISVIDVPRTGVATPSQIARNVPEGKTDFITILVKEDQALDWANPVSSGTSYAHYRTITDSLPYMMGVEF